MGKEFNPSEYKSYETLPEEQKQNFEAIEGGKGFVLKSVEKNPEIAHRLAIIEDQIINILRQEIEAGNLSFDDLLLQYRTAAEKDNYQEERKVSELLRQFSDYTILRGGDYDERLKEEFKKRYEPLDYSDKTQDILIGGIDKSDLEVGAKLLKDERFSLKSKLLEKVGDNDDALRELYDLTRDNLNIVNLLVNAVSNPNTKVEILKSVFEDINGIQDNKQKKEKLQDYSFDSIRRHVVETLINKTEYDQILTLIDDGCLETKNLRGLFHEVDSDQLLYDLATRSVNGNEVAYLLKFIADKDVLSKIIENDGQSLGKLSESGRQNAVALAKKLFGALSQNPEIHQVGDLRESNKFVVGIPFEEDRIFIGWSNIYKNKYHEDIFRSLSSVSGKKFPEGLRSGGLVEIRQEAPNKFSVVFSGSSGGFGNYGHRVLRKFEKAILEALQEKLGSKEVKLEIEVSS